MIKINLLNVTAIFIFGLIFGSFLNVVIYRIPKGISIINPRSFCPNCSANLKWFELIPLISYLIQLGKCSHCNSKISIQYPFVELGNGLLFLILFYFSNDLIQFIFYAILSMTLLCLVIIDFKEYMLPDKIILFGFLISLTYFGYLEKLEILNRFYFTFLTGGCMYLLRLITTKIYNRETFGLGDIKLSALIGFIIGLCESFIALFFGFFLAAIVSSILLITGLRRKDAYLPFGPYLIFGMIIYFLYGEKIIYWYSSLYY